jgi:hypothetical protein
LSSDDDGDSTIRTPSRMEEAGDDELLVMK